MFKPKGLWECSYSYSYSNYCGFCGFDFWLFRALSEFQLGARAHVHVHARAHNPMKKIN